MSIESLLTYIQAHQSLTLIILFLGAYFETVIATSFFIYGELFFLTGAILAGSGQVSIVLVFITLYAGGMLGDHTSYWIGRLWGNRFYDYLRDKPVFSKYFTDRNYELGTKYFKKYGGWSIVAGRFLGPASWITPFLAGIFRLSYTKFTIFDVPAVTLGIGQFILVGYVFGKNYEAVISIVKQYTFVSVLVIVAIIGVRYYIVKRKNAKQTLHEYSDSTKQ